MPGKRKTFELETRAKWERRWLKEPEKKAAADSLLKLIPPSAKRVVDLGCGRGELALALSERGHEVTALDVASNALKHLSGVRTVRACLPFTPLDDGAFDLAVCCDVIAELPSELHRLLLSEIARLTAPGGWALLATPLDCHTLDPLEQLLALFETEFIPTDGNATYGRLDQTLHSLLSLPSRLVRAAHDPEYRHQSFKKRGVSLLLKAHPFWKLFPEPSARKLRFEKASEFLWGERGITHAALVGKKRSLMID